MGDYRDIQHGVNDPVSGVDVKRGFNDNKTSHERAQTAADVRADPSPVAGEAFLPEALRRPPTSPPQQADRPSPDGMSGVGFNIRVIRGAHGQR